MKYKVISIVGARPQFIKLAPIYRVFKTRKEVRHLVLHTGQHYDYLMSDVFFKIFKMRDPDINLSVGSAEHHIQTGEMIKGIGEHLLKLKPHLVLIYGDTNSTLAGAIAASKLNIPLAHIEAGLRSYIRSMPEEINRVVSDRLSDILFCPSENAVSNLKKEGILNKIEDTDGFKYTTPPYVINCGDLMCDILNIAKNSIRKNKQVPEEYVLATIHRAENTDNLKNLTGIFSALDIIGNEINVIVPLHPRTLNVLKKNNLIEKYKNIKIIEPLSYIDMLRYEMDAKMILTDSGGVQKEAFWLKKPCITLRDKTEWVETVKLGFNILAKADTDCIVRAFKSHIKSFKPKLSAHNVYGDGRAAEKIVRFIVEYLK